jgi:hypothetical protein
MLIAGIAASLPRGVAISPERMLSDGSKSVNGTQGQGEMQVRTGIPKIGIAIKEAI